MATSIFPHTFRLHWIVSYLMVSVPTQAVLIAMFGAGALSDFIRNGRGVEIGDLLIDGAQTSFVMGVLLLPLAVRLNHRHRVRVGPYGIEAMDDRGTRWMIGWKQIDSVAIVRIGGWRSIRVRTADGRTVWLPLRVSRAEEYCELVEEYAGEAHPLSRALSFARPEL